MDRIKTAIKGFDELIEGGFVKNTVNLLAGPAGSGKSLFGTQYIYNGVRLFDETGIYITLEEGSENVRNTMLTHHMDIDKFINEGKLYIIDLGEVEKDPAKSARRIRGFESLAEFLSNLITISKAKRVVVDSLSEIAVGLPHADPDGKTDAGVAYVYYGDWNQPSIIDYVDMDLTLKGKTDGEKFGSTMCTVGDMNADGDPDIADVVFLLGYLFRGNLEPPCSSAADSNDDGKVDISDAVQLLSYLFRHTITSLPEPYEECGPDLTPDDLDCASFPPCGGSE